MNVKTFLVRAGSALGKHTAYSSPGKMPPFAAATWPANAANDCSGFVAWCLRFPSENRKVDHPLYKAVNGGWFETSAIHADGMKDTGFFSLAGKATPGSLLVYPDYTDAKGKAHDGHIGIVLEATGNGINGVSKVIHCSFSSGQKGDAIQITDASAWKANQQSIIVNYSGFTL